MILDLITTYLSEAEQMEYYAAKARISELEKDIEILQKDKGELEILIANKNIEMHHRHIQAMKDQPKIKFFNNK